MSNEKRDAADRWNPCLAGITRPPHLTNVNPDYLHHDKEHTMSITPGELRGRTQPTILLRMTSAVDSAPGNTDGTGKVFAAGTVVFAQYIGNGRLLLTPIDHIDPAGPQVVMASALNTTAEIIPQAELEQAFVPTRSTQSEPSLASGMVGF